MTAGPGISNLSEILALGLSLAAPAANAAVDAREQTERDRRGVERVLERFARAIPKAYASARFPEPFEHEARPREMVQRGFAARRAANVVFLGPAGSGKTRLAIAMLRARLDEDIERHGGRAPVPFYAHAHRLGVARIQHAPGHGEAELVDRAMRAPLLLLDDLGNERHTANDACPDVIFERHAEERPTWITTGLDVGALGERYGGGVARRIFEGATVIRCARANAS